MHVENIHDALKPISFLIGKWVSISAKGSYPTIQPFEYCEKLKFFSTGQPMLNYESTTWHPVKGNPMHMESGFLRIKPDSNKLAFIVAHNFGLTSLEEGTVDENCINLKSTEISRISFAKDPHVTEIERYYNYIEELQQLELSVKMATTNTPLTQHLTVTYKKVS